MIKSFLTNLSISSTTLTNLSSIPTVSDILKLWSLTCSNNFFSLSRLYSKIQMSEAQNLHEGRERFQLFASFFLF